MADFTREFFGQVEIVVEEIFDVDAREIRVCEEKHRGRDALAGFVFGDAAGVDMTKAEPRPYQILRQLEGQTDLSQLVT